MSWRAIVRAKQGGPIFVHVLEGESVLDLLHTIGDALDFERADHVTIEFEKAEG